MGNIWFAAISIACGAQEIHLHVGSAVRKSLGYNGIFRYERINLYCLKKKKHFCGIYVLFMWATFKKFLDIWYTLNTYVSISVSVGHRRYSFESSAASHTKKQGQFVPTISSICKFPRIIVHATGCVNHFAVFSLEWIWWYSRFHCLRNTLNFSLACQKRVQISSNDRVCSAIRGIYCGMNHVSTLAILHHCLDSIYLLNVEISNSQTCSYDSGYYTQVS